MYTTRLPCIAFSLYVASFCLLQDNSLAVGQVAKSYREVHENGEQTVSEDRKRLSQDPKGTTDFVIIMCNFEIELIIVATMIERYNHMVL